MQPTIIRQSLPSLGPTLNQCCLGSNNWLGSSGYSWQNRPIWYEPSELPMDGRSATQQHKTLNECSFNIGPPSATQPLIWTCSIGWTSRACWAGKFQHPLPFMSAHRMGLCFRLHTHTHTHTHTHVFAAAEAVYPGIHRIQTQYMNQQLDKESRFGPRTFHRRPPQCS